MNDNFKVVIPARYASSRFPGKPLADILGKTMIQRVYERALASGAEKVIIATDDVRIEDVAHGFGAEVCMTRAGHVSGSDRLAEVACFYNWDDDQIIVNVQGDEPLMPPGLIAQVAGNLAMQVECSIATLCTPMDNDRDIRNPHIVKVVFDKNRLALYFSRSVIPYKTKDEEEVFVHFYRHIGIYAYRAAYLKRYTQLGLSPLEQAEKLEQLRALWNGEKIHVDIATKLPGISVDTPNDLRKVQQLLQSGCY